MGFGVGGAWAPLGPTLHASLHTSLHWLQQNSAVLLRLKIITLCVMFVYRIHMHRIIVSSTALIHQFLVAMDARSC